MTSHHFYNVKKFFFQALFAFGLALCSTTLASAAVVTWDGGGGADTNWSTGANWSTNSVPTSSDIATFDATSTNNCTVDATTTVAGVDINSGYTGTITMAASITLNIGASNFDIAAGTFTGVGTATINSDSDIIISGGTLNAPGAITVKDDWTHTAGGTFNHQNGTVTFDETSDGLLDFAAISTSGVFYNVVVNKTTNWLVQLGTGDTLTVENNLTLTDGRFNAVTLTNGLVDIRGNLSVASTIDGTSTNVKFTGTAAQSLNLTGITGIYDGSITIDKSSNSFTLLSDLIMDQTGQDFTLTNGTFDPGTFTLQVKDQFSQTNGTYTGTGSLDVDGDFTLSGGTFNTPTSFIIGDDFTHTAGGTFNHGNRTITFDSAQDTLLNIDTALATSGTFYNFTMNKATNWLVQLNTDDVITIENTLTLTEGRLQTLGSNGRVDVEGNVICGSGLDDSTARLRFTDVNNQSFDLTGGEATYNGNITIDKAGGTVTLQSALTLDAVGQDFTMTLGTFDANGKAVAVKDVFSQSGGIYTAGSGSLDIDNDFILSGGTFNAPPTIIVADDWTHTVAGTFNHNNGTVTFDTASDTLIDLNSAVSTSGLFYNFTMNKSSNWLIQLNTGDTMITEGTLTLTDGRFNAVSASNGTMEARGNVVVASTVDGTATNLKFAGSANQNFDLTGAEALYDNDITVNKSGGTVSLLSGLTLNASNQDLILTAGTFDLNGYALTVNGSSSQFTVANGTTLQMEGGETVTTLTGYPSLASGSTVLFDGTAGPYTIPNFTYHHITFNGSGGVFQIAATLSIGGNLTITAGTFYLNEKNLTVTGSFSNDDTLRLVGNEYLTFSAGNDSNSGTVEYVGDGDGSADTYGIQNLTYYNLKVNFTDSNDTLDYRPYTVNTLVNNLVAYWKLDETSIGGASSIADSTGTYAGTPNSFASPEGPSTDVSSSISFTDVRSWDFDGTADYISTSLNLDQSSSSSNSITFTAWVKPESTSSGDHYVMSTDNGGYDWGVLRTGSTWYMYNGSGGQSTGKTVTAGTWQHIAAIWKPGTGIEFYLDGSSFTNSAISYDSGDNNVALGTNPGFGGYFDGLIDDVRIYNRALTSSEINYLKNGYNSNSVADTPLSSLTVNGSITLLRGTFEPPATLNVGGGWTDTGSGTFTEGTGTVNFTGTGTLNANEAFNNVTVNSGGTVTLGAALDVNGVLTLTAGTLDASASNYGISVEDGWTDTGSGAFTERTGTVTFDGTGTVNSNEAFNHVTLNSAGTMTLGAALDVNGTLLLTAGTLDTSASNYNVNVAGDWTDAGAAIFVEQNGTVTLDGTGTLAANEAFKNLTVNTGGTITLGAALDVDGNLTITSGTLDTSNGNNYGITVGGNWSNSGTFTARSGTVTIDTVANTSTFAGSTTFYNLTCTTAAKALTFTAGTTQTVSGTLTLTGSSGSLIVLRSTVTDSAWNLTVSGSSSVSYVDVKDSNAGGGNAIQPTNSTNSLGNTNWIFNRAPTVASITASQASSGTANVTISFQVSDLDGDNTIQAKVEYSLDGGNTWNDPTLSTTGADTSATQGDPSVNNAVTYQVGQSGAYILTSGGTNTVTAVWQAATDIASSTNISNARIRITPYDGTAEGSAGSSSNFILDRVAPTGLGSFTYNDYSSAQIVLVWTAVTETNFNHYEVWYGSNQTHVQDRNGSAQEWDNDNAASLATVTTTGTTITTDPRNLYFKIFAVDNYGNEQTVSDFFLQPASSSSSSSGSSGGGGGGGGSSSGSSSGTTDSTSDEDEDEAEAEETGESSGSSDDTSDDSSDDSSGSSSEEETVEVEEDEAVEEESEESLGTAWEDAGLTPPDHWSEGYVKHLAEEESLIETAVAIPTFMDILMAIFTTPDEPMSRSYGLEFLMAIANYPLSTITLSTRTLGFSDLDLENEQTAFIQFAYENDLVHGYPDGTFQPDRIVNRAEALKLCTYFFQGDWNHQVFGDELLTTFELTENPFSDVDLNQWYAPYVIFAYSKGVVSGYGDGTFGPGNPVTFAEFLKIATLMQNVEEAVELAEELQ